jgi:hypothetical protein
MPDSSAQVEPQIQKAFRMPMICSSVYNDRFIRSPRQFGLHVQGMWEAEVLIIIWTERNVGQAHARNADVARSNGEFSFF